VTPAGPVSTPSASLDPGVVLAWGGPRLRDLPWRATRDPWAILVAEVMLQQTQTARVIPKWMDFCGRYHTPARLAAAPLGDVLTHWHGLGYPRRARNLHDAARAMVERHGGRVPDQLDELRALPGIGAYTARAVLAFAFERDVGVVDTNIARVLARVAGERLTPKRAQAVADNVVPAGEGWAWNQVLMDLGATVCRPSPRCPACPVAGDCGWHAAGHPEPDPASGSAGVSTRQAPYAGSERERRGRVLGALVRGPALVADHPPATVASLVGDRLVVSDGVWLRLP
jgi:A/G-specific adenine glycosylase